MELSRAKQSDDLQLAMKSVKIVSALCRHIPYIEQVCLTWEVSFNADQFSHLGIWIITSAKRMWLSFFSMKILLAWVNVWLRRKWMYPVRIDCMQDESDLSILSIKQAEYDVIPVYQLAHLSLIYQKFDHFPWSVYDANEWIKQYLPHFPMSYVIGCWQQIIVWKTWIANTLESFFANKSWDVLNYLCKKIVLLLLVAHKTIQWTNVRILDTLIRRDSRQKEQYLLRRKVMRKS